MFWYILFIIVVLWMFKWRWQNRRAINMCNQLKCDLKALPILGHIHLATRNSEDLMTQIQIIGREAIKHNGLTYIWIGSMYFVVAADPVVIDIVSRNLLDKYKAVDLLKPVFGNGSLFAPVSIWRQRRKVIVPTFNQRNLTYFTNHIFSRQSSILVDILKEFDGSGTFCFKKYISNYTLDAVCESVLGVQMDAQHEPDKPFLKAFDKCCELVTMRISQPWLHSPIIYKLLPQYKETMENATFLWDFVDQIIETKRKQIEVERKQNDALVNENGFDSVPDTNVKPLLEQILSDNKSGLNDLEIREEILVLILAATDTSAVATSFAAVLLSRHQDVQEKVYQELREVFGDSDQPVMATDLPRLTYLDAVIKETLRLYPPGPITVRNVDKDLKLPSGLTLVKGTGIALHNWAMNRNPKYWGEDADVFRPERFLNTVPRHPAAFMSFSFGPRNCPGYKYSMMSVTTLLATILRKYQILLASRPGGGIPDAEELKKPLRVRLDIMLQHVDDYKVRIKSRK